MKKQSSRKHCCGHEIETNLGRWRKKATNKVRKSQTNNEEQKSIFHTICSESDKGSSLLQGCCVQENLAESRLLCQSYATICTEPSQKLKEKKKKRESNSNQIGSHSARQICKWQAPNSEECEKKHRNAAQQEIILTHFPVGAQWTDAKEILAVHEMKQILMTARKDTAQEYDFGAKK